MNRRHLLALSGAAILVATKPAAAQSADERDVAAAVEALTRAMLNPERAALEALVHDALSYGLSNGRIETKAQFVAALAERSNPFGEITIVNQTISVVGEDAIVRHILVGNFTGGGRITPVNAGVLQMWKKQGTNWRLLARQAFRL